MDMLNVYHLHKGLSTERNAQMFAYYIRAYPYLGPFPRPLLHSRDGILNL